MAFDYENVLVQSKEAAFIISADDFRKYVTKFVQPSVWFEMYTDVQRGNTKRMLVTNGENIKYVGTNQPTDKMVMCVDYMLISQLLMLFNKMGITVTATDSEYDTSVISRDIIFGTICEDTVDGYCSVLHIPHSNNKDNDHSREMFKTHAVKHLFIGDISGLPKDHWYRDILSSEEELLQDLKIDAESLDHYRECMFGDKADENAPLPPKSNFLTKFADLKKG